MTQALLTRPSHTYPSALRTKASEATTPHNHQTAHNGMRPVATLISRNAERLPLPATTDKWPIMGYPLLKTTRPYAPESH